VYHQYEYKARERKLVFRLTLQEFEELVRQCCHYCGEAVEPRGLDRLNNFLGYLLCNAVPCCSRDNFSKRAMTELDYIEQCKKVARHQDKRSEVFSRMDDRIKELEEELAAVKKAA